jgi:hypothetical protein
MEDHLGLGVLEQAQQIRVDDVGLDELEVVAVVGAAQVLCPPRAQVVEPDDAVPVRQQPVDQGRSDETCRSCHQCSHGLTIPTADAPPLGPYSRQE